MGDKALIEIDYAAGETNGERMDWYVGKVKVVRLLSKIKKDGSYIVAVYSASSGKTGFALGKQVMLEDFAIPNRDAFVQFVDALNRVVKEKAEKEGLAVTSKVFDAQAENFMDRLKPGEVYEDDSVKVTALKLKPGQTPEQAYDEYIALRDKEVGMLESEASKN